MKRSYDVAIDESVEFNSLVQNKQLLDGLSKSGYQKPSPIQLKAIPLGRLGIDLIAQAKSGTGKTVVFGVITLESIDIKIKHPQAILIAPTREIAVQIRDVIRNLGQSMSIQCEAFIGGLSAETDTRNLHGCHILVGTPGRLMSLLDQQRISTTHIKLVVLDEADKLMSETFMPQISFILKKLKSTHQTIAFSATFTDELLVLLNQFLKTPQVIKLTDGVPVLHEVQQYYLNIKAEAESASSIYKAKFEATEDLLSKISFYQCMIFVNSIQLSLELSTWLNGMGWKSGHINSNLSQEKRLNVMKDMRDFKLRVLVCSDLIARGIDIDRVNLVINLDFPWETETYLHRVGRTGRYGTSGIAINLIGPDDQPFLDSLKNQGVTIDPLPDKVSFTEYIKELDQDEKDLLHQHQALPIQKQPIKMKTKPSQEPIKPKLDTKKRRIVTPHFDPPDLYF